MLECALIAFNICFPQGNITNWNLCNICTIHRWIRMKSRRNGNEYGEQEDKWNEKSHLRRLAEKFPKIRIKMLGIHKKVLLTYRSALHFSISWDQKSFNFFSALAHEKCSKLFKKQLTMYNFSDNFDRKFEMFSNLFQIFIKFFRKNRAKI